MLNIKKENAATISIKSPIFARAILLIEGDSPLLSNKNNFVREDEKDKGLVERQTPDERYQSSLYPVPGKKDVYGFPAAAFKGAASEAASGKGWWGAANIDGKRLKGAVQVLGDIIQIDGTLSRRRDVGKIRGVACVIFRGQFSDWKCELPIKFNESLLSLDSIIAIFNVAGFSIGVGDWRPQKDGNFGMFHVSGIKPIE